MDNVPVHVNHGTPAGAGRHEVESHRTDRANKPKKAMKKLVLLSVGVIILVAAVVLIVLNTYRSNVGSFIDGGKYQAVFFTNGQVYFGKLQSISGNYMRLTDIFYLQTKTVDSTNPQQTAAAATPDVQLIKLGDEIHGPGDEMIINRDQVLFFENLKPDGKVTQSIGAYRAKR